MDVLSPPQPQPADAATAAWRNQVPRTYRQAIIDEFLEIIKIQVKFENEDGIKALRLMAVQLEENIYSRATSKTDYVLQISAKMSSLTIKFQNKLLKLSPSNDDSSCDNPAFERKSRHEVPSCSSIEGLVGNLTVAQSVDKRTFIKSIDWRVQLSPGFRERIVNKLARTLGSYLPNSCELGLEELRNIAVGFEGKIYNAAKRKKEYLKRISDKTSMMESNPQNKLPNSLADEDASDADSPEGEH